MTVCTTMDVTVCTIVSYGCEVRSTPPPKRQKLRTPAEDAESDNTPVKVAAQVAKMEAEIEKLRKQVTGQRLRACRAEKRIDSAVSQNSYVVGKHAELLNPGMRAGSEIVIRKVLSWKSE